MIIFLLLWKAKTGGWQKGRRHNDYRIASTKGSGTPTKKCRITKNKFCGRIAHLFKDSNAGPGWTSPLSTEAYLPRIQHD